MVMFGVGPYDMNQILVSNNFPTYVVARQCCIWFWQPSSNVSSTQRGAENGRGSPGIGSGKSIGLAEIILIPVEANRSHP